MEIRGCSPSSTRSFLVSSSHGFVTANNHLVTTYVGGLLTTTSISVAQGGQDVSRLNVKLEEMGRKLDHFFTTFRNEPHGAVVGTVRNTHRRILDNHRNCAISTKRFHNVAISVASRFSAMNVGSETASVVGLTRQREAWIEGWMENLAQSHLDPNEKSVSTNVTEILDDVPDQNMNTDLAFVKIHNQRNAAVNYIKKEQYSKAEKLLRAVMKSSEETHGPVYEWRESTMELLATSCCGQGKFEEAEHVLLQILSDRSDPERHKDALDTMHALAEVYLEKYHQDKSNERESADDAWTNAERYCKKAVDGKSTAHGQHDPSFHLSVSVLIKIYEVKGGDHELEAEGYRPMLPTDYWNKQRQAIEQLKALGPEGAASSIGSEIFSTLLPEECHDRWEEIKENMRRRTSGLAGSGFGYTLLHAVAEFGDDAALLRILEEETAIDAQDGNGQTPLYLAAAKGRESTVKILIDHRAKVNLGEDNKKTPLMIAAENSHQKVVLQLVDARASVRAKDVLQWAALHYAAFSGSTDVARVLLQSEAEVDVQGASDKTPLHIAASRGHESFVRLLVRNGAKISAKTRDSETPIKLAQKYHHDNVVQFLQGCLPRRKKLIG